LKSKTSKLINAQIRKKLVHRLLNPFGFAAGQLAVFQGASEAPIPHHFYIPAALVSRSQHKNGAGCSAPRALPAAHFERNEAQGI
jgi:hypothetical protein